MRVLERNITDGVNSTILIQFGSLYLTRLVISVRGGCNKCSRGNTWNKQPATDQSDYSISLKYGIKLFIYFIAP